MRRQKKEREGESKIYWDTWRQLCKDILKLRIILLKYLELLSYYDYISIMNYIKFNLLSLIKNHLSLLHNYLKKKEESTTVLAIYC